MRGNLSMYISHIDVFLSLFPPSLLSLKIKINKIFKERENPFTKFFCKREQGNGIEDVGSSLKIHAMGGENISSCPPRVAHSKVV